MNTFLERLNKRKEDRGLMADLRCVLIESKKHRAWPALYRLGVSVDNKVDAFVAGLFATHPESIPNENFGTTCRKIAEHRRDQYQSDESKLTPTERRFQHLLSAEPGEELRQRVLRMVLMAKSLGVAVNYEKLCLDLRYWNERTKMKWATAYWTPDIETAHKEAE